MTMSESKDQMVIGVRVSATLLLFGWTICFPAAAQENPGGSGENDFYQYRGVAPQVKAVDNREEDT